MLKKADVFVHQGLDGEPWREPLVNAAGNRRFIGQGEGSIDVSTGVRILEVPTSLSRMEGDIHIFGNPHYLMDPENALVVLGNIRDGLSRIFPDREKIFQENSDRLLAQIQARIPVWKEQMKPYRGRSIVVYHKSWSYLASYFDLKIAGDIEPKPGIQPTARHLADLEKAIRDQKVSVVIRESYQSSGAPNKLAKKTGIQSIELHQQPEQDQSYISLMDENLRILSESLGLGVSI
jgi:zinc/manganese transport system substrate-binding protein